MFYTIKVGKGNGDKVEAYINEHLGEVEYGLYQGVNTTLWAECGNRTKNEVHVAIRDALGLWGWLEVLDEQPLPRSRGDWGYSS